jgi:hypothetical protein
MTMYCPSCGSEERKPSQYCRACGVDLRAVRSVLEKPDAITASAISARDEIGHAVAEKIKQLKTAGDLAKLQNVICLIDGFLESPEEKRLKRIRAGVITASVGLGLSLVILIIGAVESEILPLVGFGLIVLLVGLGLVINGLLFSTPHKLIADHSPHAHIQTNELAPANQLDFSPTVTEHTTQELADKMAAGRESRLRRGRQ